jgi:hypothetical protein
MMHVVFIRLRSLDLAHTARAPPDECGGRLHARRNRLAGASRRPAALSIATKTDVGRSVQSIMRSHTMLAARLCVSQLLMLSTALTAAAQFTVLSDATLATTRFRLQLDSKDTPIIQAGLARAAETVEQVRGRISGASA